ncbi:hypothetical protein L2E82_17747 [Cichorium intybus]|uniref:Uncharacterized protein n=1 Tax=Cichorium intybus TaxID=13427 RepID=A0ACB9FA40_CICIN|nr:hypothetical protein L2E82_17747 [Cichorium intybus]
MQNRRRVKSPNDVSPIETARARFLYFIVDNFIESHVVELTDSETESTSQFVEENMNKRKERDIQYEGNALFIPRPQDSTSV